jgi:hypothetical protein
MLGAGPELPVAPRAIDRIVSVFCALYCVQAACGQSERRWINGGGGQFQIASNWQNGLVPGPSDGATFNIGGIYTVSFPTARQTVNLQVVGGTVTFNIASEYRLLSTAVWNQFAAGIGSGARLNVTQGTLTSNTLHVGAEGRGHGILFVSGPASRVNSPLVIGALPGSSGRAEFRQGATWNGIGTYPDSAFQGWVGIGGYFNSSGELLVTDMGTTFTAAAIRIAGLYFPVPNTNSSGAMWVQAGAQVVTDSLYLGDGSPNLGQARLEITGKGTTFQARGVDMGRSRTNALLVDEMATFSAEFFNAGLDPVVEECSILVRGNGTRFDVTNDLGIAFAGTSMLSVVDQASATVGQLRVGLGQTHGMLALNNGGTLDVRSAALATESNEGSATVSFGGDQTVLRTDRDLVMGDANLTSRNKAQLQVGNGTRAYVHGRLDVRYGAIVDVDAGGLVDVGSTESASPLPGLGAVVVEDAIGGGPQAVMRLGGGRVNAAVVVAGDPANEQLGGALEGFGTVQGSLAALGRLRAENTFVDAPPGASSAGRAAMWILGDLDTQCLLDLPASPLNLTSKGVPGDAAMVVEGTARLAGRLRINMQDIAPAPGQVFTLVRYGSREGCFNSIEGIPSDGSASLDIVYTDQELLLVARTAQLMFRESDNGSWTFGPDGIPGWDHVGLYARGRVYESHPPYTSAYINAWDPERCTFVPPPPMTFPDDDGVQWNHTYGSYTHDSDTEESTASNYEVPVDEKWVADMVGFIESQGGAGFLYICRNSFDFACLRRELQPDRQKGRIGGRFTCVGLIERAAEEAGMNEGEGFIPNDDEFIYVPFYGDVPCLSPELLSWYAVHDGDEEDDEPLLGMFDPVDFILTDPLGRRLGWTPATGYLNEIPGAVYPGDGVVEQFIVPNPLPGRYRLLLVGTGGVAAAAVGGASVGQVFEGPLPKGGEHEIEVVVPGPCRADFNFDGVVNSQDFFEFVTAFFASAADFNMDGLTNSQDFFDFLGAFFGGC